MNDNNDNDDDHSHNSSLNGTLDIYNVHNTHYLRNNINISTAKELDMINTALIDLDNEIAKYHNNVLHIWKNKIVPFMDSTDCVTLNKLTDRDYDKFLELMMRQSSFKYMINSRQNLVNRQQYILKNK